MLWTRKPNYWNYQSFFMQELNVDIQAMITWEWELNDVLVVFNVSYALPVATPSSLPIRHR